MASIKRRSTTPARAAPLGRGHKDAAQTHLCPLLVVPEGTRLACVVQGSCRRKRQELSFNVHGMRSRGGAPLFQVRISECSKYEPGIHLETLGGKERLAFLSTEDLWLGASRPKLTITKPSGDAYGSIQPETTGDYTLRCGDAHVWTYSGDFPGHGIQVKDPKGRTIGNTWPGQTDEEYQVFVQAQGDAGLLILGLMAIDKCEGEQAEPAAAPRQSVRSTL